MYQPLVVLIVDGLGVAPPGKGNVIAQAETPNLDEYWFNFPHCHLHASGSAVGYPSGTAGDSATGHLNIGAGKIVPGPLTLIDNAITNDTFTQNQVLLDMFNYLQNTKGQLHLVSLISPSQENASLDHLYACIEMAAEKGLERDRLHIHAITDGIDSPPNSASTYIEEVDGECGRVGVGGISTIIGRFWAMDRNENYERTRKAFELITKGKGELIDNPTKAIKEAYDNGENDKNIESKVMYRYKLMKKGDAVLFVNFASDRMIQFVKKFADKGSKKNEDNVEIFLASLFDYNIEPPVIAAFERPKVDPNLCKIISGNGLKIARVGEEEKYPYVKYFLDGEEEVLCEGESLFEIRSDEAYTTYSSNPQMKLEEVSRKIIDLIKQQQCNIVFSTIANLDLVSYTGDLLALKSAIEITDKYIGNIVTETINLGGKVIVTSSHGNSEEMIDMQSGEISPGPTTNPVPFMYIKKGLEQRELSLGILADIAPTILSILNIDKPAEMSGRDLLNLNN